MARVGVCEGFKCNMLYINIIILLFITYFSKLEPNVLKLEFDSFNNSSSISGSNLTCLIFRTESNELFF